MLKGLENFGKQVLEFFKDAIAKKYPDVSEETISSPEQIGELDLILVLHNLV